MPDLNTLISQLGTLLGQLNTELTNEISRLNSLQTAIKPFCPPVATTLKVEFGPFQTTGASDMVDAYTNQTSHGTLQILDAQGNPAAVAGIPQWATSDATVLTVTPAEDGMSFDCFTIAGGLARLTVGVLLLLLIFVLRVFVLAVVRIFAKLVAKPEIGHDPPREFREGIATRQLFRGRV